jgi:hypothetical protein
MLHEFAITDEQKDQMTALINAMTAVTGGKAEIVTRLAVVTEDERIIAAMNSLIKQPDVRRQAPHEGKPEKVWTIVSSGEQLSHATMQWRISKNKILEGEQLFHADRGNYVVDCKSDGKLTLKKVLA